MKNLLKYTLPLIFATQMAVRAGRVEIRSSAPGSSSIHLNEGAALPAEREAIPTGLTSRALASADFDEDGGPDLVTGYADTAGGGMVLIRRGNVDAIYPNSPEARSRRERGEFSTAAFLAGTKSFPVPEPADFVGVGDFDADGHWDIVTARNGGDKLYWLRGDGHGGFAEPKIIHLPGTVTALTTGEMNRPDGLTDIAVGILMEDGARVLVFESPEGALRAAPETFPLPARANALAIGQLDNDRTPDLAIAAGKEVVIIHGRDRKLSLDEEQRVSVKPAEVSRTALDSEVLSVVAGDFLEDAGQQLAVLTADGRIRALGRDGHQTIMSGGTDGIADSPSPTRLLAAKVSNSPKNDLLVFGGTKALQILTTPKPGSTGRDLTSEGAGQMSIATSLIADSEVTSVLPMRLNENALQSLVMVTRNEALPVVAVTQTAATFVVNIDGTTNDKNPGDGICADANGNCSFNAALQEANAHPGADTIQFNIPGGGVHTITHDFGRYADEAVTIDGTTQSDGRIEIVASGDYPIVFYGGNSVLRGVAVYGSGGAVILPTSGNIIEGNYIGFRADGSKPAGFGANGSGIYFQGGTNGSLHGGNNLIGGTTAQARNVISNCDAAVYLSGGLDGNVVQGNYIGTNVAGTSALPNNSVIRTDFAHDATIGGTTAGAGNLISGNGGQEAIAINATALVQGNLIGTTADGTQPLPNGSYGIHVQGDGTKTVTIGGTTPAARNVIGANAAGIQVDTTAQIQGNFIGTNAAGTGALPNLGFGVWLQASNSVVGGTTNGAGNLISGNGDDGVRIGGFYAGGNNVVQGNLIGTDLNGAVPIPNAGDGVEIGGQGSRANLIGGTSVTARNVISGNRDNGVRLYAGTNNPNRVEGNYIGLNRFGTGALGNGQHGVYFSNQANDIVGGTAPGAGNVIAFNLGAGIASNDAGYGIAGTILSNSIFSNSGLGIDRGNDGVSHYSGTTGEAPVITAISTSGSQTTIAGSLRTYTFDGQKTPYTIQFFSSSSPDPSGYGEGQTFIGQTTINAGSNEAVPFNATISPAVPPGRYVTAVAVGASQPSSPNVTTVSSEFSFCARVAGDATPENTPLRLNVVSPGVGGDTGVVTAIIIGEGLRAGATVRLHRPGEADILGLVRSVSSDGSAVEVTFDLSGRARGNWEVVVANTDGSTASIADAFTIEVGRAPRIWSYITGPSALRRDSERAFLIAYGNSGNVDVGAPILDLSGAAGTKFRFVATDLQQVSPLRVYATGAPGSAGTLKASSGHIARVLIQHAPGANELELRAGKVALEGKSFDWGLVAAQVPAGHTPSVWAATVDKARIAMGSSWDEVMANVRLVTNQVQDTSTVQNFDGLFLYLTAVFGDQFVAKSASESAWVALARPAAPAPDLISLSSVGTVNANPSHVYVLTHGVGGLKNDDGSYRRTDIANAALEIKSREPDANVYLADYDKFAQRTVGGTRGNIPDAWDTAGNVKLIGDGIAAEMISKGIPPEKTTMISESAGGPVNASAARRLQELGKGKVDKGLLLNPPNEEGGFHTDTTGAFNHSLALHTDSLYDSKRKIADHDVELETLPTDDDLAKHTGTWDVLTAQLKLGKSSVLDLNLPLITAAADKYDGRLNRNGDYIATPSSRSNDRFPDNAEPPSSFLDVIRRRIVASLDPNDKAGPGGAGELRYVTGDLPFAYAILFENKGSASAPAREVVVTDQLDVSKFDLQTFQLGAVTIGNNNIVAPPAGLSAWTVDIDLPERNLVVRLIAGLDKTSGIVTWRFISLDPVTLQPTEDALAGFLPPNNNPSEGEGAVTFTVKAKASQPTGSEVRNQARIVFDANAPIDTPIWFNTIDNSPPVSQVQPLAADQSSTHFQVSWTGSDTGAGISSYTIYASENGGPFRIWLENTTLTSAFYDAPPNASVAFYSIARDAAGNIEAAHASPDATVVSTPSGQLLNIATRLRVQTGDNVLIGGFIITGTDAKKVLIRGIGPSLANFGVTNALGDTTLELYQGNTLLGSNDNWKIRSDGGSQQAEIEATTIPPSNDLESAILRSLAPGAYTAVLRGKNNLTGIGVVECYDLDQAANSKLANIATRGFVDTNDNVMIGGLIVGGHNGSGARVLVRALGPSLTAFGVAGALPDPMVELRDGNGSKIAENNDWKSTQQAEIQATTLAPSNDLESAVLMTLPAGNFTAIVRGFNNTTGVALVEVYNVQ